MEEDYKSLGMEKEYMEDVVIYNLNKFIEYCNTSHNFEYDYDFKQHKEVAVYIENLIKEYKNLQQIEQEHKKENGALRERVKEVEEELNSVKEIYYTEKDIEELKKNQCTHNIDNECIRKSKVREVLKEVNIDGNAIKKEIEEAIKEKNKEYHADLLGHLRVNYGMKRALQQLLEEGDK